MVWRGGKKQLAIKSNGIDLRMRSFKCSVLEYNDLHQQIPNPICAYSTHTGIKAQEEVVFWQQ